MSLYSVVICCSDSTSRIEKKKWYLVRRTLPHNCYILNFEIYIGKYTEECNYGSKTNLLVKKFMKLYLNKGHHLYIHYVYNSIQLSKKLLKFKTHTTGTLHNNRRENPECSVVRKLKKKEHIWIKIVVGFFVSK